METEPWVCARVGPIVTDLGDRGLLMAFFASIVRHLDSADDGTRFPTLLGPLHAGRLEPADVPRALGELAEVRAGFQRVSADDAALGVGDDEPLPDWADDPEEGETLATYFRTSAGRNLIDVLQEVIEFAKAERLPALLEIFPEETNWLDGVTP